MNTNLRLLCASALLTLGMGQVFAQSVPDPLVNIKFTEEGPVNVGTYQGSAIEGVDETAPYKTGVAKAGEGCIYNSSSNPYSLDVPAITLKSAVADEYLGVTSKDPGSYFYMKYNKDNDALADAFLNKYTVSFVYRLDRMDSKNYYPRYKASSGSFTVYNYPGSCDNVPLSSYGIRRFTTPTTGNVPQGWSFCNDAYGVMSFNLYTSDKDDANKQARIVCKDETGIHQVPGTFYQVTATVDYDAQKIELYINGEMVGSAEIPEGTPRLLPYLGVKDKIGEQGLWMSIGAQPSAARWGDPGAGVYTDDLESAPRGWNYGSASSQFQSVTVYDAALSEAQVKSLYTADVKKYTEPVVDLDKDLLLDVQFTTDNNAKDASGLKGEITKVGTGSESVAFDATQGRNVAKFANETFATDTKTKLTANYYYRDIATDPSFTSQLGEAFTIEAYVKPSSATPAFTMCPIGMLQYDGAGDYYGDSPGNTGTCTKLANNATHNECGVGFFISTKGNIGFELNTSGMHEYEADGETKHLFVEHGIANKGVLANGGSRYLTNEYNHEWLLGNHNWVGEYSSPVAGEEGGVTGEWQHVVMVYDRTGKNIGDPYVALYVDGQAVYEDSPLSTTEYLRLPSAAYQILGIGADVNGNSWLNKQTTYVGNRNNGEFAFDGDMSICRVWGKALTYDDIQALYTEAKTPGTTVTTDAEGYATLCVPYNFTVPAGMKVQVISSQDDSQVKVDDFAAAGEVVAYGTPVIVKGEANKTYTIAAASEEGAKTPAVNLLYGTYVQKNVPADFVYELNSTEEQMDKNASEKTLDAHTAYLPVGESTASSKKFGTPTGITITDVTPEEKIDNVYYDLSGRRINKPAKGLYIQKGKTVLVK